MTTSISSVISLLLVIYTTIYISCTCEIENVGIGNLLVFFSGALCDAFHKVLFADFICFICDGNDFTHLLHSSVLSKTWYRENSILDVKCYCKNCLYFSSSLRELFPLSVIRKLQRCAIKAVTPYLSDVLQEFVDKLFLAHLHVD